ncbi:MAG: cell envelope integrity protein TolA [Legionella sp.]|nr:cell envelope integrity protein TolA [Legionella sp.]
MINDQSYRKAFFAAVFFHFCLAFMLLFEASNPRPVLTQETQNEAGEIKPLNVADKPEVEIIKAVSVDNQEVMKTVNRLKEERASQLKAEQSRQQALARQAEMARKERLQEQQQLAKLKDEAAKIAIARKKQIEEEQKRLKQLALQKEQESKRIEELKKQQQALEKQKQQETEKLSALKKKQAEQQAKDAKELAEKAEAQKVQQQKANAEQAARDAAQKAKIAGEVDKYKALIVNAISQRWILPENVDRGLSSQFRIRLAPDGAVLEVSLTRSSGDPILDRSAQTAIYKASPLPVPSDPTTFSLFRDISLTVRPENVRG